MRMNFELVSGAVLMLVWLMGVPADWKLDAMVALGALLFISGLVRSRRARRASPRPDAAYVDSGPRESAQS